MKNDNLEKPIRELIDEMQSVFKEEEKLEESLEASYRRWFCGQGEELGRIASIGLAMDKKYAAVMDLLPRVGRCLRACTFYHPQCSPLQTRFDEIENTVGPPSDQMRISAIWVLIKLHALTGDALRLTDGQLAPGSVVTDGRQVAPEVEKRVAIKVPTANVGVSRRGEPLMMPVSRYANWTGQTEKAVRHPDRGRQAASSP